MTLQALIAISCCAYTNSSIARVCCCSRSCSACPACYAQQHHLILHINSSAK